MSGVAVYHVLCVRCLTVQGGMWTVYLPAPVNNAHINT